MINPLLTRLASRQAAASPLVAYLLVDVADRLAAIGDVELRSHVASKVGEYYATNTPQTLAESRKRVQALFALGTALQEQNKLDDAIVHYRSALAIANDIAHQPPTDLEVRADALRIRASIAQAMAIKGQIAEAEQEHHALVARHEELVAIGPSIARRRELALARTRLGAILLQRGSLEAALAEARSARDLLNAVPPSSRDDATMEAEWHTRHLLGDIAARQNDPTAAVVEFRAAVDLSERLASAASRDVKRIVRQATSQQRVGDMHFKLGQYAESLAAAERALEIQESLAMRDPANSRWQHAYAAAHMRVANARAARKEYGQALTHELAALDVIKRLVAHDPANVDWQIQLAVFHLAIHSLLSAKQDDAGDEQHVRAALVTLEAIVERNPAQSKVLRLAADAYGQLDQILAARGELEPAMLAAENAVRRARQLSEVDPSRLDVLARTSERHGDLLLERRDNANALVAYRATWTQYDQLSKKGPHFRVDAARARRKLGIAGNDRGELEKARDELERLISEAPENRPAAKELASVRAALDRCCKPR